MRRFLYENGLSLAFLGLFLLFIAGQAITGYFDYQDDLRQHGQAAPGFLRYLTSGHFIEATFENWESEFLQMGMFLILTQVLHQKGSAESRNLDHKKEQAEEDEERRKQAGRDIPGPMRHGGITRRLYEHSLTIVFFLMFIMSILLHAWGGARLYNLDQSMHGGQTVTMLRYMVTSHFWFESFQNWQSEFLALFSMIVLSIFLRTKESPESKRVDAPHAQTKD